MSARAQKTGIILGGVPRAELLPPELEIEKKAKAQRRSLMAVAILVVAATVVAYGLATAVAQGTSAALDDSRNRGLAIQGQQLEFIEVTQVQQQVDDVIEAQQLGTSTEIDWRGMIIAIEIAAPVDTLAASSITVKQATPVTPFDEPTAPFEKERVAEIVITGGGLSLSSLAIWMENLRTVPGYTDSTYSTIAAEGGIYVYSLTVHINSEAFTKRFAETEEDAE